MSTVPSETGNHSGTIIITGTVQQGELLSAYADFFDPDGFDHTTITYGWWVDGLLKQTGFMYAPEAADVYKNLTVTASYFDSRTEQIPYYWSTTSQQYDHTYTYDYSLSGAITGTHTYTYTHTYTNFFTDWSTALNPQFELGVSSVGLVSGLPPVPYDDIGNAWEAGYNTPGADASGNVLTDGTPDSDPNGDLLTVIDVQDLGGTVGIPVAGVYGTVVINADGGYLYTLNNSDANVQQLFAGQTVTDVFKYTVSDGHGGTATAFLTISITGANDAPVVFDDSFALDADQTAPVSGNMLVGRSDPDGDPMSITSVYGLTESVSRTMDTYFGHFQIQANGDYTYWLDTSGAAAKEVPLGVTSTETVNFGVADGIGGVAWEKLVITVTGVNDAPVLRDDGTHDVPIDIYELPSLSASPTAISGDVLLNDFDPDSGDAISVTSYAGPGNYGSLFIDADGRYSYVLDNNLGAVDALNVGDTLFETFTYGVADNHGAVSSATLKITIHGNNDAAVFGGEDAGSVTEAGTTPGVPSVTGALTHTDVDNLDNVFQVVNGGTSANGYGSFDIDASGHWTYRLDNAHVTVQHLRASDQLTDSFIVHADDGTLKTVTIAIQGANDAPTASDDFNNISDVAVGVTADVGGSLFGNDNDVDGGSLTLVSVDGHVRGSGMVTATGVYGSLVANGDGNYNYRLDVDGAVNALGEGEVDIDVFHYKVSDHYGGTDIATLTITVTGINDAPVAQNESNTIQEDASPFWITGNLSFHDIDLDDVAVVSLSGIEAFVTDTWAWGGGHYGDLWVQADGHYSYYIDNLNTAVQALHEGQVVHDVFTYTVSDGLGGTDIATIDIAVSGANDAPIALPDVIFVDPIDTSGSGNVLDNDFDVDASGTVRLTGFAQATINLSGDYGVLQLTDDGGFRYDLNTTSLDPDIVALNPSQSAADFFTYHLVDSNSATAMGVIAVVIHGLNDGPSASSDTNDAYEAGSGYTGANAIGNVLDNDSDPDNLDSLTVVTLEGVAFTGSLALDGQYGTLTLHDDGSYVYHIDELYGTVAAMSTGDVLTESFTYVAEDRWGAQAVANLVITLHGRNDDPTAHLVTDNVYESGVVVGDSLASGNVILHVSDAESDSLSVIAVDGLGGNVGVPVQGDYGVLHLAGTGGYTYTLDQSAADSLRVGETVEEVFAYQVSDGHGGTDIANLVITIHGANDAPIAFDDAASMSDATSWLSGNVTVNDVDMDIGDALHAITLDGLSIFASSWTSSAGSHGILYLNSDGVFSYSLHHTADVLAMQSGEYLTDSFHYGVSDGHGGTDAADLTITVWGANDAAWITGITAGFVTERGGVSDTGPGNLVFTGHLSAMDVDNTSDLFQASTGNANFGAYSITELGHWEYRLDDLAPSIDSMGGSDWATDSFTIHSIDGTAKQISIVIYGANDTPVANDDYDDATEDSPGSNDAVGNVFANDTDADAGDTKTNGGSVGVYVGNYGSLTLNADGSYSYAVNDSNPAVNWLRLGTETLTDSFNYTVRDAFGAWDSATLTITIHGANDAPVAFADFGDAAEAGASDPGSNATGNVLTNDADVDYGDGKTVSAVAWGTVGGSTTGSYGTLTLSATGGYSYAVDNANALVQALGRSTDILTDSFFYTVRDTAGATATAALTITIHGANDTPVAAADSATAIEAGVAPGADAVGNVLTNDSDVDGGDTKTATLLGSGNGTYGTLTLNPDGTYTYVVNDANPAVDSLRSTDTLTDPFMYRVTDATGASAMAMLTVTIQGANDAPVGVPDAGSATEAGATAGSNAIGNVLSNDGDVDAGEIKSVSAVAGGTVNGATVGSYGTLTLNDDGSYSYAVNDANFLVNALRQSADILTDSFTYTVRDIDGATSTATLTVTIHGANDAPVGVDDTANAVEGQTNPSGNVLTNDTDVDAGDGRWVSAIVGGSVGIGRSGSYGTLTLGWDGSYNYVVDNANAAVDALRLASDTLTDSFTYTVQDMAGATSTASLTITIHGDNDSPVAADDSANAAEAGTSAGVDPSGNVLTNDVDVDQGDTKAVSVVTGGTVNGATVGSYGTLTLNSNGSYTYAVDNANAAVNALNSAGTLTDTFIYTMEDASTAIDQAALTVTIHGANDAPVGVNDTGAAIEAGKNAGSNAAGNVLTNDTDVDAGDTRTVSAVAGGTVGSYGTLTLNYDGSYSYVVNDANAAVDALGQYSDILTDSFSYTVQDAAGATDTAVLTVTIHGAQDAPLGFDDVGSATETGTAAGSDAAGNVLSNDFDPDAGDSKTVSAIVGGTVGAAMAGAYGSLTLNFDGSYSYAVNEADPAVDALRRSSDTLTDSFTYTVRDLDDNTSTATLTITIHGANDAPVAGDDASHATEAGVMAGSDAGGNVLGNDSDVDTGDSQAVIGVNGAGAAVGQQVIGSHGALTLDAAGGYVYVVDNADTQVDRLAEGMTLTETFSYTMSDGAGATSVANLVITIDGANDAPVASADVASATEDGGDTTGNLLLNDGDVDVSDVLHAWSGTYTGEYGVLYLSSSGDYLYDLDDLNPGVDALALGETLIEAFTYTVSDAHGATAAEQLTITIHGANDTPVAFDDSVSAWEAGVPSGSVGTGNVLFNDSDVDLSDTHVVVAVESVSLSASGSADIAGDWGTLTLHGDGSYVYVVDDANATVEAMNAGQTLSDSFGYTMADNHGATSVGHLTVVVHGANDAPVGADDSGDATEAGTGAGSDAVGNVLGNDSDVDNGDSRTVGVVAGGSVGTTLAGLYGSLTLNSDGSYSYVLDDADPTVNALGPTGTLTDSFSYTVRDAAGATDTAVLTITVHGANDAPTGTVTITGVPTSGQTLTASSNLADPEGLGTVSYQWRADDVDIFGATGASFVVTAEQAGKAISVVASYVDGAGTLESLIGTITAVPGLTILGTPRADVLIGSIGNDVIDGNPGRDSMSGGAGDDTYYVNEARDLVNENIDEGVDTVIALISYTLGANVENLTLGGIGTYFGKGNALNNVITGNGANNQLNGFGGQDILTGGLGADTFIFSVAGDTPANAPDVVTDFNAAQRDKIDLRTVDAREGVAGNQAFRFIGTAEFTGNAIGLLRFDPVSHMLLGSTDADLDAEIAIVVVGVDSIVAANIML